MCLSNFQLDEYIRKRALIAISRENLNSIKLQGFPLAYSPNHLLLRYVFDFYMDGLLLVRRRDLTDCFCRETDNFQRTLLETENKLKGDLFHVNHAVDSFDTFLKGLNKKQIVIIENESPESPQFFIGRLVRIDSQLVTLREFSGAGNWERDSTEIPIDDVTCCQIETNYIKFYSRHFDRTGQ